jgi:hypothetical protein
MKKQTLLKKIMAAIALLFALAMPQTAQADIYILSHKVTPENCNDLSSIFGVTGSVSYDFDTGTLTLDHATISSNNITEGDRITPIEIAGDLY